MQFKVPQFLEIEDKIFGPFTFRQFIYLVGGGGLCFVLFKLLGFLWGSIPILAVAGFSLGLAFYRPNNKPFINMIESGIKYATQSKLYIWKKRKEKPATPSKILKPEETQATTPMIPQKLSGDKLRDLAWSLNVLDLSKKKES